MCTAMRQEHDVGRLNPTYLALVLQVRHVRGRSLVALHAEAPGVWADGFRP